MVKITVSAESLAIRSHFVFKENTPEHRAVEIIKRLNLRTLPDTDGVLAKIGARKIEVIPQTVAAQSFQLEVLLFDRIIYQDADLTVERNQVLQEANFYANEREFCVLQ